MAKMINPQIGEKVADFACGTGGFLTSWLIKEGKIKKEKNPSYIFRGADNLPYEKVGKNEPVCIADEVPFEIPESWEWVRLKNCCIDIFSGKSPKYVKSETAFHIIGQAANQNTGLDFSQCKYTDLALWDCIVALWIFTILPF